ncbi:MAG: histone family protein [Nanoarchaeota archaeon]
MARKTTVIPKAPFGRILMNAGAKRVSSDAIDKFTEVIINKAEEISERANKIAKHSGRKTIHEKDIKLAYK